MARATIAHMDEKDNKTYELAVLVKTEDDLPLVMALVRQHKGEVVMEPRTKKLALAYEIKKHKEAVFAYCHLKASGEEMKSLEHDLNTSPTVIRSLVIASPAPVGSGDGQTMMSTGDPTKRRTRVMRSPSSTMGEVKPAAPKPLSNEALEKKIEEILQ